ncbi:MAG TPA: trehalose-phosphatase [Planctomycetaceae bacterium]|jgi:trehalose-phosphatase
MNDSLHDALERMRAMYRRGHQLALLFDYDGSLTEFTARPAQATMPPATRRRLEALATLPGVTLGVISGRELDELERLVGIPDLFYAGTDGLELEYKRQTVTHPLVQHSIQLIGQIAGALERVLRDFPAAWLERKHFGLTLHYRQLDSQLVPELQSRVDRELKPWEGRLHLVTGAKAIEITPDLGWTKGTAIEFVLERLAPVPCCPLFAGDEASDIEAMWRVSIHGGVTIGVGHLQPTIAQFELSDTNAVLTLLDDFYLALSGKTLVENAGDA